MEQEVLFENTVPGALFPSLLNPGWSNWKVACAPERFELPMCRFEANFRRLRRLSDAQLWPKIESR